jgi:hypothetical protein
MERGGWEERRESGGKKEKKKLSIKAVDALNKQNAP